MGTKALRAPDGTIYDVPEADVSAALADGYQATDVLLAPDGAEYDVPVADVDSALKDGYRRPDAPGSEPLKAGLPVPQDVQAAAGEVAEGVAEQAPSWGQTALAGVQGLTRYLGGDIIREAGNRAEKYVQGDVLGIKPENQLDLFQERSEVEANRKAAPVAAAAGEIAGLVGSAFVPAARLANTAKFVPAVGLAQAGNAAARIIMPKATGLLGKALGAVGTAAVVAGGENIAQGAFDEINDAFLKGDYRGLAERIPARVVDDFVTGAKWGGGIAAVGQVGKVVLKSLRGKADDVVSGADEALTLARQEHDSNLEFLRETRAADLAQAESLRGQLDLTKTPGELEADIARRMETALENASPKVLPEPEGVAKYVDAYDGFKRHGEFVTASTPKLKQALDFLEEVSERADEKLTVQAKNALTRRNLNELGQAIQDPEVDALFSRMSEGLDRAAAEATDEGTLRRLKGAASMATRSREIVSKALKSGDAGDAYVYLENFKRELGKLQKSKQANIRQFAEAQYDDVKRLLEREDLFGEVGARQRPFNAAWKPEIDAANADALSGMLQDTGKASAVNPWLRSERVKTDFAESVLRDQNPDKVAALRQYIATKTESLSTRAELLGDADMMKASADARVRAAEALAMLDDGARLVKGAREWPVLRQQLADQKLLGETLGERVKGVAAKTAVAGAGAAVGGLIGGPVGAVVGGAATTGLSGLVDAFRRGTLERDLARAQEGASRRAAALKASADVVAAKLRSAQKARDKAASKAAQRTEWTGKIERAIDKAEPAVRRGAARKALIELDREQQTEPTGPLSALTPVLGPVLGPELAQAYAQQRAMRNAFLLEKAGPAPVATPFGQPERVVSDEDAERFGRYVAAADDSDAALQRLADGTHYPEDMETLRALYPSKLDEFRTKVLDGLTKRKAPLAYDDQLALAESLGIDAALYGEATAFWSGVAQAGAASEQSQPAPRGTKLDIPGAKAQTTGDRIG